MPALRSLTRQDARRLAISRQHLDGRPPPPMLNLIRDLGCIQLDPIRHVERTHLLTLWSRLGQFEEAELDKLRFSDRRLFEYWAHAASLVLTEEYPVHKWHMDLLGDETRSRWARNIKKWFEDEPDILNPLQENLMWQLRQNGPMLSREFETVARMPSSWSSGRYVSRLLDYLWSTGEVMVYGRPGNQRQWGLAEEFWPNWTPQEKWEADQVTTFAVQKAIRALGVATPKQIKKHYTRGVYPGLANILKKLTEAGTIEPVQVVENGAALKGDWYLHVEDVSLLTQIQAGDWRPQTTLLSPFDNLICDRDRTELLWDFHYRIEIYVPVKKREYGYYVLPLLRGDRLIGRVDSKMDRKTKTWHIHNIYAEKGASRSVKTIRAIRKSIKSLAKFLGTKTITWGNVPDKWGKLVD
ncbi:MAG: winged helix-turn-helix domain-containing protein [Chloroflexi bacterium]|nr:winged helix-turn-helix domain-containing protein [Chloroflexota bacterium]